MVGVDDEEKMPSKGFSLVVCNIGGDGPLEPVSLRTSSSRRPTDPACDPAAISSVAWSISISALASLSSACALANRLARSAEEATDATALLAPTLVWLAM